MVGDFKLAVWAAFAVPPLPNEFLIGGTNWLTTGALFSNVNKLHDIKPKTRSNSGEYMDSKGRISARYKGSKYWNEDAKHGIEMGVTMIAAPVAFSPLTEVEGQVALINYITKGSRVFVSLETIGKTMWNWIWGDK